MKFFKIANEFWLSRSSITNQDVYLFFPSSMDTKTGSKNFGVSITTNKLNGTNYLLRSTLWKYFLEQRVNKNILCNIFPYQMIKLLIGVMMTHKSWHGFGTIWSLILALTLCSWKLLRKSGMPWAWCIFWQIYCRSFWVNFNNSYIFN